ncbi:MAG: hypothetical protein MOGMAGMI_02376 [Candidatus Omnitrophica bacterium]|nr:hypothetical protein [Candidatus Omnitrophota bacterium]
MKPPIIAALMAVINSTDVTDLPKRVAGGAP